MKKIFEEFNDCNENEEYDYDSMSCLIKCPSSFNSRDNNRRCLCNPEFYEIWMDNGSGMLTLSANVEIEGYYMLSEIEFYDPNGNKIQILTCNEKNNESSTCSRLFDTNLSESSSPPFISSFTNSIQVNLLKYFLI